MITHACDFLLGDHDPLDGGLGLGSIGRCVGIGSSSVGLGIVSSGFVLRVRGRLFGPVFRFGLLVFLIRLLRVLILTRLGLTRSILLILLALCIRVGGFLLVGCLGVGVGGIARGIGGVAIGIVDCDVGKSLDHISCQE